MSAKQDILRVRSVFERLNLLTLVFTLFQVPYFILCEFLKLFGQYSSFYYPNGGWAILGWVVLIIVLYVPFYGLYFVNKDMI